MRPASPPRWLGSRGKAHRGTFQKDLCETLGAVASDPFTLVKIRVWSQNILNDFNNMN